VVDGSRWRALLAVEAVVNRSRTAILSTLAALAIAVVTVPAVSAGAVTASPAESIVANVSSGPFHIMVTGSRAANSAPDTATGTFTAQASLGALSLFALHGPVTCLDIRGNSAGLFYPITSSSPSIFSKIDSGVFIYFRAAGKGLPALVGFVPVPIHSTKTCAPGAALLPVTSGSLSLTS
jgi:hypothetical protein